MQTWSAPNSKQENKYVALDVEHTDIYDDRGKIYPFPTQLSIVDYNGKIIFNEYFILEGKPVAKPSKKRKYLNIQKEIKRIPYLTTKPIIENLLKDKIIIGHDLAHDFIALGLDMYKYKIIDTAKIPFFMKTAPLQSRKLKNLVDEYLGYKIQTGIHNAANDARATMNLYKEFAKDNTLSFQYPHSNIEYSKKVLEEAKKYGLNREKYEDPNLIEFPTIAPKNYSEDLSQLLTIKPSGKPNLIGEHMRNLQVDINNKIRKNSTLKYEKNLEGLFSKKTNLIGEHMRNLQVETNRNLVNLNMPNNKTRKNSKLKYEKNLEGLFPIKQKTTLQKLKNYFTKKTRKNRK